MTLMTDKIFEALILRNMSDFTKVRSSGNSGDVEQIAFFKMIMTLSNFHSTVSDMYLANGDDKGAKYHQELSMRFRNEANRAKNKKI